MLDDRPGDYVAEPLTLQMESFDQCTQGRGQQLLVVGTGVGGMLTRERCAYAAEDGDALSIVANQHIVSGAPALSFFNEADRMPRPQVQVEDG